MDSGDASSIRARDARGTRRSSRHGRPAQELKVAAVAQKCADLLLDLGRTDEAAEVALHALSIIPTHTALTETPMRAHAANPDRLAVQRVYEEHVGASETLDLDDAEESTSKLCERLLGRAI